MWRWEMGTRAMQASLLLGVRFGHDYAGIGDVGPDVRQAHTDG